jgi:hypothetical protein
VQPSPTRPKLPPKFAQFNAALSVPTFSMACKGPGRAVLGCP